MVSGHAYPHYLFSMFPIFALAGAYIIELIFCCFESLCIRRDCLVPNLTVSILMFVILFEPYLGIMTNATSHNKYFPDYILPVVALSNYIESNTEPDERFMVYTAQTGFAVVNLINDRWVEKFIHSSLFLDDDYYNNQYMNLLYNEQPRYFIVADQEPPNEIFNYLTEHYRLIKGDHAFKLYELVQ
jgi:hypothetical protein